MSDEEEYEDEEYEDEEEVEEEVEDNKPEPEVPKEAPKEDREEEPDTIKEEPVLRRAPPKEEEPEEPKELTEAEQAMLAARKRHEEEEAAKLAEYERNRKTDLSKIDEELRILKEKQEQRRKEREQEEREFAERCRMEEERRKQEEEERKSAHEEEKKKKIEEKNKRQNIMAGGFNLVAAAGEGGANYTVQKREGGDKAHLTGEGPKTRGPSAAQLAEMKKNYMAIVARPRDIASALPNDLKEMIKQLAAKIERINGEKYDLEKRLQSQEYDLKELKQREQQAARNKALEKGVDPTEIENIDHPPKISVASKFDRQTDRRSYKDRLNMFEKPTLPPPPKIAHGTARPPPEWGRKHNEELEMIRKNLEPPKYQELAPIEGARPPVAPKPLVIPEGDEPEPAPEPQEPEAPVEVEAEA